MIIGYGKDRFAKNARDDVSQSSLVGELYGSKQSIEQIASQRALAMTLSLMVSLLKNVFNLFEVSIGFGRFQPKNISHDGV